MEKSNNKYNLKKNFIYIIFIYVYYIIVREGSLEDNKFVESWIRNLFIYLFFYLKLDNQLLIIQIEINLNLKFKIIT